MCWQAWLLSPLQHQERLTQLRDLSPAGCQLPSLYLLCLVLPGRPRASLCDRLAPRETGLTARLALSGLSRHRAAPAAQGKSTAPQLTFSGHCLSVSRFAFPSWEQLCQLWGDESSHRGRLLEAVPLFPFTLPELPFPGCCLQKAWEMKAQLSSLCSVRCVRISSSVAQSCSRSGAAS